MPTTRSGEGMDAALTMLLFLGIGYVLDRWLGTTPWFMTLVLTSSRMVGLFYSWKARYTAQMECTKRSAETPPPVDDATASTPPRRESASR